MRERETNGNIGRLREANKKTYTYLKYDTSNIKIYNNILDIEKCEQFRRLIRDSQVANGYAYIRWL